MVAFFSSQITRIQVVVLQVNSAVFFSFSETICLSWSWKWSWNKAEPGEVDYPGPYTTDLGKQATKYEHESNGVMAHSSDNRDIW